VSEFTAIRATSMTLQRLLEVHITNSAEAQLSGVPIELASPRELRAPDGANATNAVSLWLYRVSRNPDLLNQPPVRTEQGERRHALPIELFYLVAPITPFPANEQALLGRVLQVLNDHATVRGTDLIDDLADEDTELRVTLETLTLEELTRIWNALDEPYQLSVSYRVQVIEVESGHEPAQTQPVEIRRAGVAQLVG
jgi:hypothetical protein